MKLPFQLWKRGEYYYYRIQGEKTFHSTGISNKRKATDYVYQLLDKGNKAEFLLGDYIALFYIEGKCPHIQRLQEEGKSIGTTWIEKCRSWLEYYIMPDKITRLPLGNITRNDILEFRSWIYTKNPDKLNTVNKVMSVLKIILKEAFFRQHIKYDPSQGIGNVKEKRKEPGTFTLEELQKIFPHDHHGPWKDKWDYTCFFMAACTGMCRGEILGLKWK